MKINEIAMEYKGRELNFKVFFLIIIRRIGEYMVLGSYMRVGLSCGVWCVEYEVLGQGFAVQDSDRCRLAVRGHHRSWLKPGVPVDEPPTEKDKRQQLGRVVGSTVCTGKMEGEEFTKTAEKPETMSAVWRVWFHQNWEKIALHERENGSCFLRYFGWVLSGEFQ